MTIPEVASIRIVSGGLFILPFTFLYWKELDKKLLPKLLVCGLVGTFIPGFLFSTAGTRLNSAASGSLNALTPVFTILLGILLYKNKLSLLQIVGIIIGFGGAIVLAARKEGLDSVFDINEYAFLVVLATLCYAINIHLTKRWFSNVDPKFVSTFSLAQIAVLALIVLLSQEHFRGLVLAPKPEEVKSILSAFVLGFVGTGFATKVFMVLIKRANPVFSSSVTYLIPVFAIFWGLYDGEPFTFNLLFGIIAVMTGVLLVNRLSTKSNPS